MSEKLKAFLRVVPNIQSFLQLQTGREALISYIGDEMLNCGFRSFGNTFNNPCFVHEEIGQIRDFDNCFTGVVQMAKKAFPNALRLVSQGQPTVDKADPPMINLIAGFGNLGTIGEVMRVEADALREMNLKICPPKNDSDDTVDRKLRAAINDSPLAIGSHEMIVNNDNRKLQFYLIQLRRSANCSFETVQGLLTEVERQCEAFAYSFHHSVGVDHEGQIRESCRLFNFNGNN